MGKQATTNARKPTRGKIPAWTRGDKLRKARVEAGITTIDMAKLLGVSRYTVTNYEHGHTDPSTVQVWLWGRYTGVDPRWIDEQVTEQFCDLMDRALEGAGTTPWYSTGPDLDPDDAALAA